MTTLIIEENTVLSLLQQGEHLLICSEDQSAIDDLLERYLTEGEDEYLHITKEPRNDAKTILLEEFLNSSLMTEEKLAAELYLIHGFDALSEEECFRLDQEIRRIEQEDWWGGRQVILLSNKKLELEDFITICL